MPDTVERTPSDQGQETSVSTDELQAIVEGGNPAAAEAALDNQSADTIKKTIEAAPTVNDAVTEAKAVQLDGLRAGVTRAAETTNQLVAEADAREAADFTPDAQINRMDIVDQQRDTNRAHEKVYGQERKETLVEGAAAQEAQHTQKEPLIDKVKKLWPFGKKPTDANTGGGEA